MRVSARRPSLLFVNQYYHPDVAATGQHLTDLAESLAAHGFPVSVYAARASYASAGAKTAAREVRKGVSIRRFPTTSFGRATHMGRIIDYLSFYAQVLAAVFFGRSHDLTVYLTTPPLIGVIGWAARAIRGQRYAIWSMDLHPQAEIASGMLRPKSAAGRLSMWVWRRMQRGADLVIALGPFMQHRIVADGGAPERIAVVPPWSHDIAKSSTPADRNAAREIAGIDGKFVIMYSGNAGLVHDFRAICDAMALLDGDDRFFFLFIGDGPRRAEIERFARERQLRHFAYRDYAARIDIPSTLGVADAHLISLRPEFAGISVPSKLYGIMASRRPVVFVGPADCESAQSIREADCGVVVDSAGPSAGVQLAEAIRALEANATATDKMGENGGRWFQEHHRLERCCAQIEELLATAVALMSREGRR